MVKKCIKPLSQSLWSRCCGTMWLGFSFTIIISSDGHLCQSKGQWDYPELITHESAHGRLRRVSESCRRIKVCCEDTFKGATQDLSPSGQTGSCHGPHLEVEAGQTDGVIVLLFALSLLQQQKNTHRLLSQVWWTFKQHIWSNISNINVRSPKYS